MMKEYTVIEGVYVLKEKIAEGGMAVVFRADVDLNRFDYTKLYAYTQVKGDTHSERVRKADAFAAALAEKPLDVSTVRALLESHGIPVPGPVAAVKVSKGEMSEKRFEAEWRNLICLNHDNVVKVYGGGIYMNRLYYAMELIEGIVPPDTIRKGCPFRDRITALICGANGLAYLHEQGIIHRDVKPDNLVSFRDADGVLNAKVTDLGLAKSDDRSMDLTATGQIMGTPYYMAPEQIESSRDVDYRADIYSLGASLYDLLIGVPPFHDKTSMYEIIASVSRGETPIPPQDHLPWLPDVLSSIIKCAMDRDPAGRYQDIRDMAEDLETYLREESPELLKTVIAEGEMEDISRKSEALKKTGKYIFERIASGVSRNGKASIVSQDPENIQEEQKIEKESPEEPVDHVSQAVLPGKRTGRKAIWIILGIIVILVAINAAYNLSMKFIKDREQQTGNPDASSSVEETDNSAKKAGDSVKEATDSVEEDGDKEIIKQKDHEEAEYITSVKYILNGSAKARWISFKKLYGKQYMNLTSIQKYSRALSEVQYSFDTPSLSLKFELSPEGAEDTGKRGNMIRMPDGTERVYVRLTYKDGTKSDVMEFTP